MHTERLGALLLVLAGCPPAPASPSIKIGVLLPYTGESAGVASNLEQALLQVTEQVNRRGGIGGLPLELVIKDSHSTIERADEALDAILGEQVVAVVGPESAELALHIEPRLEDAGVVFLSPFVSSGTQPMLQAPWFRIGPPVSIQARAQARDVLAQGHGSVVVLFEADDLSRALADEFEATYTREGGVVLKALELPSRLPSYFSQLEQLNSVNADAVVLLAEPLTGAQLVNELSFLPGGMARPFFLGPALQTEVFLKNTTPHALEGARGVAAAKSEFSAEFAALYRQSWQGEEPVTGAYYFHDAMVLLSLSLGLANWRGELTPLGLSSAIRTVSAREGSRIAWDGVVDGLQLVSEGNQVFYQGLTGTMIMNPTGERLQAATAVWSISGGRLVDEP